MNTSATSSAGKSGAVLLSLGVAQTLLHLILVTSPLSAIGSDTALPPATVPSDATPLPTQIESLRATVLTFGQRGDFLKAQQVAREVVRVSLREHGEHSTNHAYSLDLLAAACKGAGQLSEAVTLSEQSLAIKKTQLPGDHPAIAASYFALAALHHASGNFNLALDFAKRSLKLTEEVYGADHPEAASVLLVLARIYFHIGDYRQAVVISDRAIAVSAKRFASDPYLLIECLADRALATADAGMLESALQEYQVLVTLYERCFGSDHPNFAAGLQNLASLHADVGNITEALALYDRSVGIKVKLLGKDHPDLAMTLCNIAGLQQRQGNLSLAMELYQRAQLILESGLGPQHYSVVVALVGMASVHQERGELRDAERLLRRSLEILEESFGKEHPKTVVALNNLASLYEAEGRTLEAIDLYERGLAVWERSPGAEFQQPITMLWNLALLHMDKRQIAEALIPAAKALRLERAYLVLRYRQATDPEALTAAWQNSISTHLFHSVCALATEMNHRLSRVWGAEQLATNKGLLEEVRTIESSCGSERDPVTRELIEQRLALLAQLETVTASPLDSTNRNSSVRDLEEQMRRTEARLREQVSLPSQRLLEQELTHGTVVQNIPHGAALLDFVHYYRCDFSAVSNGVKEARYAAYVTVPLPAGPMDVLVDRVDIGQAALVDEAIAVVVKRMSAGQFAAKDLSAALQRLSDLVYGPLASYLTNVSHLIICPDGQLSRLPFEMLSHNGRFLIEDKTITYVGSGREVVRLAQLPSSVKTNAPLVIGNPDFELDLAKSAGTEAQASAVSGPPSPDRGETEPEPWQFAAVNPPQRSLSRDCRGLRFDSLPGAEAEAREAAKLLGGDAVLWLGAQAREAALKAVISPRVLHLSTHGFYLSDQEFKRTNNLRDDILSLGDSRRRRPWADESWENPMIRCGLALAGANHAGQLTNAVAEDGLLTGLEAALLNLQGTELVVLSACDSGSGDVKIGEGVMSLRRAFRIAGAQTVLASHWKVNDRATARLMTEFMRRWQGGEPRGQAWRQAQLSLLRSADFSNPYFWAAFTLTGQWR